MSRRTDPDAADVRAEQRLARWAALTPDERAQAVWAAPPAITCRPTYVDAGFDFSVALAALRLSVVKAPLTPNPNPPVWKRGD